MSVGRSLCVAMLLVAGAALAGCEALGIGSPTPTITTDTKAAWPDHDCSGTNAMDLYKQIAGYAKDAHDNKTLSDADYKQITDDIAKCKDGTNYPYKDKDGKPNDDEHCGHVTAARDHAKNNTWIACSKELELGHM